MVVYNLDYLGPVIIFHKDNMAWCSLEEQQKIAQAKPNNNFVKHQETSPTKLLTHIFILVCFVLWYEWSTTTLLAKCLTVSLQTDFESDACLETGSGWKVMRKCHLLVICWRWPSGAPSSISQGSCKGGGWVGERRDRRWARRADRCSLARKDESHKVLLYCKNASPKTQMLSWTFKSEERIC